MKLRRMFIDPASKSTGWVIFEGNKYIESGTICANESDDVFNRLDCISRRYHYLMRAKEELDEVHIEQLVRNTHIYTHWSVGVIGTIMSVHSKTVAGDIPIQSWQKHVDWKDKRRKLKKYGHIVKSEDELAAIGMGLWYVEKY